MNRKSSIDILRIFGALAVVALHTLNAPVMAYKGELSQTLLYNLKSAEILMEWVVPVFFMITGYCLANKKDCGFKYCFGHVRKYVIVLFTIGLFYALLEEVYAAKESGEALISLPIIGRSLLNVVNGNLWDHMWFVYSIIGIYLVMPVIHSFMQTGERNIRTLTILLYIFTILIPEVNRTTVLNINIDFPLGSYLFYVCFGAMARKCEFKKWAFYTIIAGGILAAIYMVNFHTKIGRYDNLSPFLCIYSMAVFLAVNRINFKGNKLMYELAACTWGIYLVHPVFLNIGIKLFKIDLLTEMPYLRLTAAWLVVFLLSFGLVWILRRMPLFKKIL